MVEVSDKVLISAGYYVISKILEHYGSEIGFTIDKLPNNKIKYRLKENPKALGVWISVSEAHSRITDHLGYDPIDKFLNHQYSIRCF